MTDKKPVHIRTRDFSWQELRDLLVEKELLIAGESITGITLMKPKTLRLTLAR